MYSSTVTSTVTSLGSRQYPTDFLIIMFIGMRIIVLCSGIKSSTQALGGVGTRLVQWATLHIVADIISTCCLWLNESWDYLN